MVVDDDPLILQMLSRVLHGAGYRVVTHNSGFGLASVVREHQPDLMLLDVGMPGLGGDRALATLRDLARRFGVPEVPVIFHSGLPAERLETLARTHGAIGHLCKPATRGMILDAIHGALLDVDVSAAST